MKADDDGTITFRDYVLCIVVIACAACFPVGAIFVIGQLGTAELHEPTQADRDYPIHYQVVRDQPGGPQ